VASTPQPWLNPGVWAQQLHGAVESILDAAVGRALTDPLPVHNADDVAAAVRAPAGAGMTTMVVPVLAGATRRWSRRIETVGSRLSFTVKALLAAVPSLASSVTLGTRELHALASLVVNQLRDEGLPVDRRFVQRVAVNAYVWPAGGRALEQAQAPASARVAGLWATRPLAREQTGEWAGRAAKLIDAADLCHHFERYDAASPELESGS
jgi:hypothetical protein